MGTSFELPLAYNAGITLQNTTINGAGTDKKITENAIMDNETEEVYSLSEIEEMVQNALEQNQDVSISTGDIGGEYNAGTITVPVTLGYAIEFHDFSDAGGPLHQFTTENGVPNIKWLETKLQQTSCRIHGYYPHQTR